MESDPHDTCLRAFGDDEEKLREGDGSQRRWLRDDNHAPERQRESMENMTHLRGLETLLRDSSWHPFAIPLEAKRCLVSCNSR